MVGAAAAMEDRRSRAAGDVILRVEDLSKTFDGNPALVDVDFDVRAGEVHALVGHNGSGKSTLIKVLAGFHHADPGARGWIDGHPVSLSELGHTHGHHAPRLRFVHQDLGLVLELNAVDNLALRGGFVRNRTGRIRWREQAAEARELLASFNVELDVLAPLAKASPVERTIVSIAGALQGWEREGGVLVLDEPTAVLPPGEAGRLHKIICDLRDSGAGILFVSHRLDEVMDLGDRVTVLRNGREVASRPVSGLTKGQLVHLMLGEEMEPNYRASVPDVVSDEQVLEVDSLSGRYLRGATFAVRRGEVLGISGLPDSGRDELPRLLTDRPHDATGGRIKVAGEHESWVDVHHGTGRSVVLLPPDRVQEGVIGPMTVQENLSLAVLDEFGPAVALNGKRERTFARNWVAKLDVVAAGLGMPIKALSGGNQQKVLFGRVLAMDPKVLVLCEPTAGVDVGARHAIYDLVAEQVREGLTVLVVSSDVGDLLALCTRVLVLGHGVVAREITGAQLTEHELVRAMEGVEDNLE
jgi:ABC-type sugar transport system ATPase subunit